MRTPDLLAWLPLIPHLPSAPARSRGVVACRDVWSERRSRDNYLVTSCLGTEKPSAAACDQSLALRLLLTLCRLPLQR